MREITADMLAERGFCELPSFPHGLVRDFGGGQLIQLVPHHNGWMVEVWNGVEDGFCRVGFRNLLKWDAQLALLDGLIKLCEDIPF